MKTPLAKDIFDSIWNILERYCILLYRGTLRETVHRKNRKQIPLIRSGSILVDLDRLRLCTFSLPFTLDPKIVHSFPFRAPRYFPVSILFDILLQIERFLALPPSEKRSWNAFKIGSRSSSTNGPFPPCVYLFHSIRRQRAAILLFQIIQLVVSTERKYFGETDYKSICHFASLNVNNSRESAFKIKIQYSILDENG